MTTSTNSTDLILTEYGLIRRTSSLVESIRFFISRAKSKLNTHITDEEINNALIFRFNMSITSKSVSAAEKKIPKQYESLDYSEFQNIDFGQYFNIMREKTLIKLDSMAGEDVTDVISNFFQETKQFVAELTNQTEREIRTRLRERMAKDSLVSHIQPT